MPSVKGQTTQGRCAGCGKRLPAHAVKRLDLSDGYKEFCRACA